MLRPIKNVLAMGRAIREARKARGWTQSALGEYAGVTQATVSTLERGEGNPTMGTVLALASVLGLNLTAEMRPKHDAPFPWENDSSDRETGAGEDKN